MSAIASADWAAGFVAAAAGLDLGVSLVGVAGPVIGRAESAEEQALEASSGVARRAGALLRLVWRRPSALSRVWGRQELRWEGQERLADAVVAMIASLAANG
ncbi:MAG: hypothetical protein AAF596_03440 [Planctomycetota bacterium]